VLVASIMHTWQVGVALIVLMEQNAHGTCTAASLSFVQTTCGTSLGVPDALLCHGGQQTRLDTDITPFHEALRTVHVSRRCNHESESNIFRLIFEALTHRYACIHRRIFFLGMQTAQGGSVQGLPNQPSCLNLESHQSLEFT
jgi:hypothetical protein